MYQGMQDHDKKTITKLVKKLIELNCTLVISDEESTGLPTNSYDSAIDWLGNSELNRITAVDSNNRHVGTFLLIYGNGARETIADCTDNIFCESVCAAIGEPI